jgi:uncharacterized protein YndB with AHSA1/START domain
MSDWWPPERRHTGDPRSRITVEPGGRFWERSAEGEVAELGAVRDWEPPSRLVLDWYPGTGPEAPTEVEVRFVPEGDGTRVVVTHRPTELSVDLWGARAPRYVESWDLVLAALERAAK